jgi:threonine dehydrogenase-like Zn-dependent dehydrogenase
MSQKTARANLLDKPDGHFVVGEYPIPDPVPGAILARIELCGVCGTDIHTWHAPPEAVFGLDYPISLGHEISAKVEALGEGVSTDSIGQPLAVGDRIGFIPAIHCGRCYYCRIAKTPEKCTSWITYGTWGNADQEPHFTGGYSDYIYLHHPNTFLLKSSTTAERTAFMEPMAVVVHSLLHAQIEPGDTVVVQGSGPIGLLTIGACKIAGASRIIATGRRNRRRLDLAKGMGADLTICQADMPSAKDRKEFVFDNSLNLVGADVVINTAGVAEAFKESLNFVRDSGTVVEVGNFVDSGTIEFNPCRDLLEKGIKIIGADERIPLDSIITHRVPLGDVEKALAGIESQGKLDGKEIVKIMMDPSLPET